MQKRSVNIARHPTSVSIEEPFWETLKILAAERNQSLSALIADIDGHRTGNLSSALRLFVLRELRWRCGLILKDDLRER